ncbi:MAG: sensor histidine kinase [Acidobacteria bacterium]|nr:sensor histidine kinase [Acidobacteriota bacterium]
MGPTPPDSDNLSTSLVRKLPAAAASAFGVLIACLVLGGWAFDVMRLRSIIPGQPQMFPNTALAFIFASASLWLLGAEGAGVRGRFAARACALLVCALSLLTLAEYAFSHDMGIDRLLFSDRLRAEASAFAGRPSPHTAFSFFLLATALLFLGARNESAVRLAQMLALSTATVALLALVGYIYRVTLLYGISAYTGMALHTALTFMVLSFGVLWARPERGLMSVITSDTAGGLMARHLFPTAVLTPILLGVVIVIGARRGLYDTTFGMSLCVMASIIVLSALVWRNAKMLYCVHAGLEGKIEERTAELSQLNEQLQVEILEHQRAEASRVQLLRRLVTAQEEERRRISRELHDHMAQHLSALMLRLKTLNTATPIDPTARHNLQQIQELTDQLVQEVHHMAWELRPAALDDLGLRTALANYAEKWAERSGVAVDFHSSGLDTERLSPEVETSIYRIVQEALTNVLKHAGARRVSVILERRREQVLVIIEDDGRGFEMEAVMNEKEGEGSLGLLGMHERVALVGGTLNVESRPGAGTTLVVRIPVSSSPEKEVFPREYTANHFGRRSRRDA